MTRDGASRDSRSRTATPKSGLIDRRAFWLMLAIALVTRAWQFGNPVIQVDEQFYLLAGDRLLRGSLPFVDIWDRKPLGLFGLYAAIRVLGGAGIVQYQIVATLFAAATAAAIASMAMRLAGRTGAIVAGAVYLVFIMANGGDGGQAPVFYNLPVALAALLVMRVVERPAFDRSAAAQALGAMALLGLAIQIKYSVVFEGMFFGLFLAWHLWRKQVGAARLLPSMLIWCAVALVPTALAALLYGHLGFLQQFLFANFESIFIRSGTDGIDVPGRLLKIAIRLAPAAIGAAWGLAILLRGGISPVRWFVAGWLVTAVAALLGFGTYHYHYALPLLVPFALAGAPLYEVRRGIGGFILAIGAIGAAIIVNDARHSRGDGVAVYDAAHLVGTARDDCIFVFNGDPALYLLTRSCLPTRYAFPPFISERRDAGSLADNQIDALRAAMATRPRYVFTRSPAPGDAQPAAWAYMKTALALDYRLVFRERAGEADILGYVRNSRR
jgi:hypothetical protein